MPRDRGRVVARGLPGAEVHQHEAAALLAHHVLRLDVAVHQAGVVDGGDGAAQILADQGRFARAERTVRAQQLFERGPADQFHPQADAPFVRLGAVDGDDVVVFDAGEAAAFAQHAAGLAIGRQAADAQQLHRDFAIQLRVAGAIHLAERAFADAFLEFEMPPTGLGRRRRRDLGAR